jgi:hypothetical protein
MRKLLFFVFLGLATFFNSCKNDLEVNAPWKDTTIVFGLLNKGDSIQYIRISKAFLGEGNALDFAKEFDSLYYKTTDLDVKMEEYKNGLLTETYILTADSSIDKEPGIFNSPKQLLYTFNTFGVNSLDVNASYKLVVKNNKTGNEVSATTNLVSNPLITKPTGIEQEIRLYPAGTTAFRWQSSRNGYLYEAFLRFLYKEIKPDAPNDTAYKYVELNLGRQTSIYEEGTNPIVLEADIENKNIYQALFSFIPQATATNQAVRFPTGIEFIVNATTNEMNTYISVNQPSNTITQERPQYTNITNGIGIFSSRGNVSKFLPFNDNTLDSLQNSPITNGLNFQ